GEESYTQGIIGTCRCACGAAFARAGGTPVAIPRLSPRLGREEGQSESATAPPVRRSSRPIRAFAIVVLVAAIGAAWFGYGAWQPGAVPAALSASGTLEADETLVSPKVTGTITALPVSEGSAVSAGTVVARIDDRVIQVQIQEADVAS